MFNCCCLENNGSFSRIATILACRSRKPLRERRCLESSLTSILDLALSAAIIAAPSYAGFKLSVKSGMVTIVGWVYNIGQDGEPSASSTKVIPKHESSHPDSSAKQWRSSAVRMPSSVEGLTIRRREPTKTETPGGGKVLASKRGTSAYPIADKRLQFLDVMLKALDRLVGFGQSADSRCSGGLAWLRKACRDCKFSIE